MYCGDALYVLCIPLYTERKMRVVIGIVYTIHCSCSIKRLRVTSFSPNTIRSSIPGAKWVTFSQGECMREYVETRLVRCVWKRPWAQTLYYQLTLVQQSRIDPFSLSPMPDLAGSHVRRSTVLFHCVNLTTTALFFGQIPADQWQGCACPAKRATRLLSTWPPPIYRLALCYSASQ